ncbi:dTDP-4-dehydrorhamnose reductase [Thorsellia kenyensis]|uniref:dTDP-4-dehydrorhamnose reductase n=1 Tax=Thorsellia kenyensis TaxID=1549888 RepID=A0ABV6C7S7_9GAMM
MKILLTGAKGQLGQCIQQAFPKHWSLVAYDSKALDITNREQVYHTITKEMPDVIINAAAYTAVDNAEEEVDKAFAINEKGILNLAQVAKLCGTKMIHISTDYVFDGLYCEAYTEEMQTNPQSIYGQSKLAGEQSLISSIDNAIIIRTAWVFSEFGQNFFLTMRRLFNERDALSIVGDQIGNPTYAGDLARAIIASIEKEIPAGIYHYSGNQSVSWYEFAQYILDNCSDKIKTRVKLSKITSNEYPQKAKRPQFSKLSNSKLSALGIAPSDWKLAVQKLSGNIV